ncbi:MAG: 50S ribosomal protein L17 [Olsenella sp.]|nr:50S ribosomal protein L17 [Olsenella sp.]
MRHNKKSGMKLGTDASHTKAIKKGLVASLLANDRIKTTVQRAKAIRPDVDKVVTWAKKGDLHSRRLAIAKVGDAEIVREVFEKAAQGMWADRDGGYTRIMKLGNRKGDNAEVVIIEMVTEPVRKKAKAAKTEVKKVEKVEEAPEAEETVETEAEPEAVEEAVEAEPEAEATEESAE